MPFKDHFQTLRVSHRASPQQIQKAYYERLKFFHPDYFQDDPARHAIAELEAKSLNEAFEAVSTPAAREAYLREWERHQNPLRLPSVRGSTPAGPDVGSDLTTAREQIRELQALLDQRGRELRAANLGARQSQDRLKQLQLTAENQQDIARKLEARLIEREQELQAARDRDAASQSRLRRLEQEMAEDSGRQPGPIGGIGFPGLSTAAEAERAVQVADAGWRLEDATSAREDDKSAEARIAEQQRLLDAAAHQIRSLRARLDARETVVTDGPNGYPAADPGDRSATQDPLPGLADVPDSAEQRGHVARHGVGLPGVRFEACDAPHATAPRSDTSPARSRAPIGAAGWLDPPRANALLTVLLLALCAVAVALILLTVSFDADALRAGLERLGQ